MYKKYFLVIFATILVGTTLSGCSLKKEKQPAAALLVPPFSLYQSQTATNNSVPTTTPTNYTSVPEQPAPTPDTKPTDTKFQSIDEAMNKQLSLKCPYVDESGNKVAAYIKDRKVIINSNDPGDTKNKNTHILFRYSQAWIWNSDAGEGATVVMDTLPTDKSFRIGKLSIRSTADVLAFLEQKKSNCSLVDLSDDMFQPPTNIKFAGGTESTQ